MTATPATEQSAILLSVIVPCYNEEEVIDQFFARLVDSVKNLDGRSEAIFIDDGSKDGTLDKIFALSADQIDIQVVQLSRNFGKEAAMSAGLAQVRGQAVILIDADLQDPPELIGEMVEKWRQGFDVVNMQRSSRQGETALKKFTANMFYKVMGHLSETPIPQNVGDFRLLSRRVIEHINALPEKNRYMKGLLSWPGFNQTTVQFERDPRLAGETKWNYGKLFGLAIDGITAFSTKPLRLASWAGSIVALSAFVYGVWIVLKTMLFGETVAGYPSLMVAILGLGGVQLLAIGILGEYLGRVFVEVKARPNYLIDKTIIKDNSSTDGKGNQ
ncbi:glycosyltransferase family 2 protein [Paraferrimonas sp. SM1919]|uniref:glycosyltransferase family 2 protein n=1 Tax=Paraferrimonas sp. SM1919 TaxID=2662263 RepID=UPI0013D03016|nr:glycosyltransferase family 2 protein [Paraferrimonas sp. SM1919]